ncbi:hypothetical protein N7465_009725 [Penicillium sp. CMV-2018d]|nr:hypothetical protein N7465_009725 [Penicillium sp. CMV-2018d]
MRRPTSAISAYGRAQSATTVRAATLAVRSVAGQASQALCREPCSSSLSLHYMYLAWKADRYDPVDEPFITQPPSAAYSLDLFSNLHSDENTAAYLWDYQSLLDGYGQPYLPTDEAIHNDTLTASTISSDAAADLFSPLGGGSAHRSSSGTHHDVNSSSEAPSAAASLKSESLHRQLIVIHTKLITLSESLAVSFSMTDDIEVIYKLSAEMTEILQRLKENGPCYPPMPVAKCQGMTSLLILGCYSYLLEAYEFTMEKLRHELQDTGSPAAILQQRQQQDASPEEAPQINIGGIRLQVSRKSAAEIHLQLVSQTAQNLRESLGQFVKHTAAPRCSMDLDTVDESPASNRTGSRAGETGRGDTIDILTKMAQREMRRREDGIFQAPPRKQGECAVRFYERDISAARDSGIHDYNTILDQLRRVYDNPNKTQEAKDRLLSIKQVPDETLAAYIAKFERVLYEAKGQDWPDVTKISTFRKGLQSSLRTRLSQQLNLPRTRNSSRLYNNLLVIRLLRTRQALPRTIIPAAIMTRWISPPMQFNHVTEIFNWKPWKLAIPMITTLTLAKQHYVI